MAAYSGNAIMLFAGIAPLLLRAKKSDDFESKANRKMNALIESHKKALRDGRLLTSEI